MVEVIGEDWAQADPESFPAAPYPGLHPPGSWRLTVDGELHRLRPMSGWWVDHVDGTRMDLTARRSVLGYASNRNPEKLAERFAGEDIVVLSAQVRDWAAVWCRARRRDGSVVATLAPWPGAVQEVSVLSVTVDQLATMDAWEGHPLHYRRQSFNGACCYEDGRSAADVEVYLGTDLRPVLLHEGGMLRCGGPDGVPHELVDSLVPHGG